MHLDPAVRRFAEIDTRDLMAHLDVPGRRHYMRLLMDLNFLRFSRPGPELRSITEHTVATDGGQVRCRVYRPSDEPGLPAHLTLHGGGWWQGSIDDLICDAIARQRCTDAHMVVVTVEYRLAPEHPFPVPLDDAYRAYLWLCRSAAALGVNPDSFSVGGSSAGANLAAALAIRLRDEGQPAPVAQLLEVPALDLTLTTGRRATSHVEARMRADLDDAVGHYLPDRRLATQPLASPLLAENLHDLPPTVIFTAEHDVLREDGERYAGRLTEAGVPARVIRHPGALHGTAMLTRTWEPAAAWQREAAEVLRTAHWPRAAAAAG